VRRVPLPIPAAEEPPFHRAHFGLSDSTFIVLFLFNFLSYMERKNPLAAVRAFRHAFTPDDDALLLLKTSQADFASEASAALDAAIGDARVRRIDDYLDRREILALTACCDTYLSLHRSEGFGLTLAEAMAYGKPVVATPYSGNADFFTLNNGLPVRYRLVEIQADAGPYPAGSRWADPDPEHAGEQLRALYDDPGLRRRLGERARADIAGQLSDQAVAEVLRQRFDGILRRVRDAGGYPPTPT
jgi:glycosyltransferase involved in cell wall biosynthesis